MTTVYSGFVDLALQMISDKGKPIIVRRSSGVFDPVAGDVVPDADCDYDTHGVFLPPGTSSLVRVGTLEIDAQWRVLIPGKGLPVSIIATDKIIDGDTEYSVVGPIEKVAPNGTPILFDVFVRE